METHIKFQSLPTWAETLTACQRPERGCVLSHPRPRIRYSPRGSGSPENRKQKTVVLEMEQMWSLNEKRFCIRLPNLRIAIRCLVTVYNTSAQINYMLILCPSSTLKAFMGLSCSLCSMVYSLLSDIRPCWTAGRESHRSGRPSPSWWNSWEICFRPACNRYDRQERVYCLKTTYDVFVSTVAGMNSSWSAAGVNSN